MRVGFCVGYRAPASLHSLHERGKIHDVVEISQRALRQAAGGSRFCGCIGERGLLAESALAYDLLSQTLLSSHKRPSMLVRDIMNRVVHTVAPDASVQAVAALMRDRDIGAVVVALGRQLVGIVTDRDLTIRVLGADLPSGTQVVAVMSGETICCAPDDDVNEVLRIMRLHQVRRTPVTSKDRVVGIVSLCDIAIRATDYDEIEMTFADLCDRATKPQSDKMEDGDEEHRRLESRHI